MNYLSKDGLTYLWTKIKSKIDSVLSKRIISADSNAYISTAGNDTTGDGTESNPWATFAKAISEAPVCNGGNYTINVLTEGTYDSVIVERGRNIEIGGATATVPRIEVSSNSNLTLNADITIDADLLTETFKGILLVEGNSSMLCSSNNIGLSGTFPASVIYVNANSRLYAYKITLYSSATSNIYTFIGAYANSDVCVPTIVSGVTNESGGIQTLIWFPGVASQIYSDASRVVCSSVPFLVIAISGVINPSPIATTNGGIITQSTLNTTSKNIIGAINENKTSINSINSSITTINSNLTKITNGTTAVGKFGNITNLNESYNTEITGNSWIPTTNSSYELNHTTFNNLMAANITKVALASMKTSIVSADYGSYVICIGGKIKVLYLNMKITANGNIFSAFSGVYVPTVAVSVNATWPIASTTASYKSGYISIGTNGIIALADAGTTLLSGSYNILRQMIIYY